MNDDVQTGSAAAWVLVPDEATIHLSTRSEIGNNDFAGSAQLTPIGDAATFCADSDIHDGPCSRALRISADRYRGEIAVAFDSVDENRVAIDALIVTREGQPHGIPYHDVVSGRRGAVETVSLFIGMREA